MWISGLEIGQTSNRAISNVIDLSATPFFLRGSGLCGGDVVPVDGDGLFVDGCD